MGQLQRGLWKEKGEAGKTTAVQNLLGTRVTLKGAETRVLGKSSFLIVLAFLLYFPICVQG